MNLSVGQNFYEGYHGSEWIPQEIERWRGGYWQSWTISRIEHSTQSSTSQPTVRLFAKRLGYYVGG